MGNKYDGTCYKRNEYDVEFLINVKKGTLQKEDLAYPVADPEEASPTKREMLLREEKSQFKNI